ncbi:MAG: GNAT family N-acetyltransferase [Chlorobi bacterium]|nr:GNAT family N-acetyltransferase [Chlorobiota bacterium]
MQKIIKAFSKADIKRELKKAKFIRQTNNANNQIYFFNYHDSALLVEEVGRLRELTFRNAGGGTGKSIDVDEYDTAKTPYEQLIVWDPEEEEILGGYRFLLCKNAEKDENGDIITATSRLFNFSDNFKHNYLPVLIELGRSFVQPVYQSTKVGRKALFALDNLWDGLGALVVENPEVNYFFGKVTMYPHYNRDARNMILYFMNKHFKDNDNLLSLKNPLKIDVDIKKMETIFTGKDYLENQKILSQKVREFGENVPPLINAYINLSPTMKTFGTSLNPYFGNVEETAIMVTISDVFEQKKERHVNSYINGKK